MVVLVGAGADLVVRVTEELGVGARKPVVVECDDCWGFDIFEDGEGPAHEVLDVDDVDILEEGGEG